MTSTEINTGKNPEKTNEPISVQTWKIEKHYDYAKCIVTTAAMVFPILGFFLRTQKFTLWPLGFVLLSIIIEIVVIALVLNTHQPIEMRRNRQNISQLYQAEYDDHQIMIPSRYWSAIQFGTFAGSVVFVVGIVLVTWSIFKS